MPREAIFPTGAPGPTGAYSPVVRAGPLLFVSGQGPTDSHQRVRGSTLAEQIEEAMRNVQRQLEGCGASLADIVSVTVFLANIHDFDEFDRAYAAFFPEGDRPARTTVGVQLEGILVEIQAIAYIG